VRLNREHLAREEYVEAASHAAIVFTLREDAYWRRLEPLMEVNRPSFAAVDEARRNLLHARDRVSDGHLKGAIGRMLRAVQPVHDALASSYDGPPITPGSTLSGYAAEQIRAERFDASRPAAGAKNESNEAPRVSGTPIATEPSTDIEPRDAPPASIVNGDSSETIESHLLAGRSSEALAICERVAQAPGTRSLGQLLNQYGRALNGVNRPLDAAVMFMRCAVLYPTSAAAGPSLIETALLYQNEFRKPDVAQRLLEQAIEVAGAQGETEIVERARTLLAAQPRNRT